MLRLTLPLAEEKKKKKKLTFLLDWRNNLIIYTNNLFVFVCGLVVSRGAPRCLLRLAEMHALRQLYTNNRRSVQWLSIEKVRAEESRNICSPFVSYSLLLLLKTFATLCNLLYTAHELLCTRDESMSHTFLSYKSHEQNNCLNGAPVYHGCREREKRRNRKENIDSSESSCRDEWASACIRSQVEYCIQRTGKDDTWAILLSCCKFSFLSLTLSAGWLIFIEQV